MKSSQDNPTSDPSVTFRLSDRLLSRRRMFTAGAAALGGAVLLNQPALSQQPATLPKRATPADKGSNSPDDNASRGNNPRNLAPLPPGEPGKDYTPVIVPNGWALPYKVVDGVKVFHLVAEDVYHEFAPGLRGHCWGYNGSVHGPCIEAVDGDRLRIFVTNKLGAPTTVHWHGILLPSGMDGVGGLSQKAILPGETYMYEFTLRQRGTFMYHSHHDEMTQMGMGMVGMIVIHPRGVPKEQRPDRDFVLQSHEWAIEVGTERPDPNVMTDFNVLTFNAKAFPGTAPLVAKLGDKVRMRFGNLSAMDHHPIHLHGYYFKVTETDGGRIPDAGQWPETTVLVAVGSTRTVEFVADNPGDWAMHCHMTHHVMNQMGHGVPNMVGVDPKGLDEKVRKLLPDYMTMGQHGMGDMGDMAGQSHVVFLSRFLSRQRRLATALQQTTRLGASRTAARKLHAKALGDMGMRVPPNSIPMVGGRGPHDYITMGGMFTILKVRESLPKGYDVDPGWYQDKPGEISLPATPDQLKQNGIATDGSSAPKPPTGVGGVTGGPASKPSSGKPKNNNH